MSDNIRYITVVGVDGCGKSTWSNSIVDFLGNYKKVIGLSDKIFFKDKEFGLVNISDGFYIGIWQNFWKLSKSIKNKFLYKIFKIIELILRIRALKSVINRGNVDIVVSDGTPLINILAWGSIYYPKIFTDELCIKALKHLGGISKMRLSDYIYYFKKAPEIFLLKIFHIKFPFPDVVVFLRISPDVAISRINSRGEKLQFHETKQGLTKLHGGYDRIIRLLGEKFDVDIFIQEVDNLSMLDNEKIISKIFYLYKYD